jgi:hypothetical protein
MRKGVSLTGPSDYQIRKVVAALTGLPDGDYLDLDIPELFGTMESEGRLSLPFDSDEMFVFPSRIAVFADIMRKDKSLLVSVLSERDEETALVVDSNLKGKDAMFFARLLNPLDRRTGKDVSDWLNRGTGINTRLVIQSVDDETLVVVAAVRGFVVPGGES